MKLARVLRNHSFSTYAKFSDFLAPDTHMCVYQEFRNVSFSEILCTFYRMNPKSIFSYDSFRAHATIFSILPSTLQQSKWHLLCHLFWMLQAHKMKFSVKDF